MKTINKTIVTLGVALGLASGGAMAQGFDQGDLYLGGGINFNSVSGRSDTTGFQLFGGYKLRMLDIEQLNFAAELGYMDSGRFDGAWINGLVGVPLSESFQFMGRAGIDLGDDDGLMFGIGAAYALTRDVEFRVEYVVRDRTNSTQINAAYHF